jgi:ribosomal protein S18 acetylase RimI-like enzyme
MPEIEIRPSTPADLPTLGNLDHSYQSAYVWQMERQVQETEITINFREIRLPRLVRVEYPRRMSFLLGEASKESVILVALMESIPVGYLRIQDNFMPGTVWVMDGAVHPELRRKGIATALLLAAQGWASQRNFRRIICEMQSKNYPGIHLVQKLGYEFSGFSDHYYSNQDIALFFNRLIH